MNTDVRKKKRVYVMRRRYGFSLIEVIGALTAGSVMVGVAVGVLYMLFRMDDVAREHLHQGTVLCRLAEQFRRDVNAATAVSEDGDDSGTSWKFVMAAEHTVVYSLEAGGVARTETAAGEKPRRESYRLPSGMAASMRIDKETSATIVSLLVVPVAEGSVAEDAAPPGRREAVFDALLAADHRFENPREFEPGEPASEETND